MGSQRREEVPLFLIFRLMRIFSLQTTASNVWTTRLRDLAKIVKKNTENQGSYRPPSVWEMLFLRDLKVNSLLILATLAQNVKEQANLCGTLQQKTKDHYN